MSEYDRELPRSKVAIRGKMLVAWFADATPPVLWRWVVSDVSSGFGLRQADGKFDLVRYDGGVTPMTIATFASIDAAEQALSSLSRTLLSFQAPWKKIAKWTAIVVVLLLAIIETIQLNAANHLLREISSMTGAASPAGVPASFASKLPPGSYVPGTLAKTVLPALAARQQQAKPATVPTGAPVDVDSFYH